MKKIISQLACLTALFFAIGSVSASDLTLYVAPDGSDQSSGMSEDSAVKSLQVAVNKALANSIQGLSNRKIVILPGNYLEQVTIVKDISADKSLVISGRMKSGIRPIFNGNGKGRSWLILDSSDGRPSRLTIENIEVVNYVTAISLNGKRALINAYNSENIIQNNIFKDIGQIAFPEGGPSTAAIRLVNSRGNQITNNKFVNIRNNVSCSGLHSIYVAHYSSENLIQGNTFDGGCGATVKTRDASDSNIIRGNRFLNQSEAIFLDKFCDKDSRVDCTKATSECPSWGNEFKDNSLANLGSKEHKKLVRVFGSKIPNGCPQPLIRATRLIESNNLFER